MTTKIVVGVDGSEHSQRAVEWCARYAAPLEAEVVVVHAIEIPVYAGIGLGAAYSPIPAECLPNPSEMEDHVRRDWCAPLKDASAPFKVVCRVGFPTSVITRVAQDEDAAMVVTGRRGRGGFAELVLGSTSHELSHHADRPLVIVP